MTTNLVSSTERLLVISVEPFTTSVPAAFAFPLAADTTNLVSFTDMLPVTSAVPAASTWRLAGQLVLLDSLGGIVAAALEHNDAVWQEQQRLLLERLAQHPMPVVLVALPPMTSQSSPRSARMQYLLQHARAPLVGQLIS